MRLPTFDAGRRRALAALAAAAAWGLAAGLPGGREAAAAPIGTAVVFGDAFSARVYETTLTWVRQLDQQDFLTFAKNSAKPGSFASSAGGPRSLLGQVDAYLASGPTLPRFTIVYFGTEDVQQGKDLAVAKANYQTAVNRLIAAGANAGTRKLVLVQLHDATYDPGVAANVRSAVVDFNRSIQRIVASRPNVRTVNLGVLFDRVVATPGRFGLTNVTTPNAAKSETTALYFDALHFGTKGHSIIADEVKRVLSR